MKNSSDSMDHHIKVIAQADVGYKAVVDVKIGDDGSVTFQDGAAVAVLNDLQFILDFTYECVLGTGWVSQRDDPDMPLTGMGEQLLKGLGDLSISPNKMYEYRAKYLHFLPTLHQNINKVYFQQPSLTSARTIHIMPFESTSWFSILAICILIGFVNFWMTLWTNQSLLHVTKLEEENFLNWMKSRKCSHDVFNSLSNQLICLTSIFFQQGWYGEPRTNSLCLLYLVGVVTSSLLYSFYTAAFLVTISGSNNFIRRYEDFQKYGYTVYANPEPHCFPNDLVSPDTPAGRQLYENSLKLYGGQVPHFTAVQLVTSPHSSYGFVTGSDLFHSYGFQLNMSEKILCKVKSVVSDHPDKFNEGMAIRKNSPLKEPFTQGIIKIIERGLNRKYWTIYDQQTQVQCLTLDQLAKSNYDVAGNGLNKFSLADCSTAFIILMIGYILSLLILFLIELFPSSPDFVSKLFVSNKNVTA